MQFSITHQMLIFFKILSLVFDIVYEKKISIDASTNRNLPGINL